MLCTPAGLLAEGPGFNFFLIKDKQLMTPKSNMLEGITRQTVFDLVAEPLAVHGRGRNAADRRQAVYAAMEREEASSSGASRS